MLAKILSGTTIGLDGVIIEVEVDVASKGFPYFNIVGLPSKSVDEAKERVRTAIVNSGFKMPDSRITINLAPADIPKNGSGFDLPITIGILVASGIIQKTSVDNSLFIGELSLQGDVRRVPGIISMAILSKHKNISNLFVPKANGYEASLVEDISIYPINNLKEIIFHLNQVKLIDKIKSEDFSFEVEKNDSQYFFEDIKGQELAKRGLMIAAAGFHNVILKGPPGTGKTYLSRAFPTILPPLKKSEILEVTKIYSVTGLLKDKPYISSRPFRAPHHTTSRIGLVGGGSTPTPGEISLAHRGVLFMDELPEFPRSILESLRQPLEDGFITISRVSGSLVFPCRFLLLAASNPCPCGYLGHPKKPCRCLPGAILKYKKRLSGPLLDRIDIHADAPFINEEKLINQDIIETSQSIRDQVIKARNIQRQRFINEKFFTNGEMSGAMIKKYCILDQGSIKLLKQAVSRFSLSARSYFKVIKIARTIADLDNSHHIKLHHLSESLQFRPVDD